MFDSKKPWHHNRDNLYFQRHEDGSVTIAKFEASAPFPCPEGVEPQFQQTIPALEWASIIASASYGGETSEKYQHAVRFHQH